MRPARLAATLLAVALLAAGCSRCGAPKPGGPPPERFVPADAAGVVLAPGLGAAAEQAAALYGRLAALPGGSELVVVRTALGAQLGLDPLDPASLRAAGLDPARGAALAALGPGASGAAAPALLVLPIGDAKALDGTVARLARDRLGAAVRAEEPSGGRQVTVWRRASGEPALLAALEVEGSLLLCAGPDGPAAVATAAALTPDRSLSGSAPWTRLRAALGAAPALVGFVPAGSPALAAGGARAPQGLAFGVSGGAGALRAVLAAGTGERDGRVRALLPASPPPPRPPALDPATPLALRLGADPAAVARELRMQARADLDPSLLDAVELLAPGVEVGLGVQGGAGLARLVAGAQSGSTFLATSGLQAEVAATVRDPAAFEALLGRWRKLGWLDPAPGGWRLRGAPVEVAFALRGDRLAATLGRPGELPALLGRLGGAGGLQPPSPAAADAWAGALGGGYLHGRNLEALLAAVDRDAPGPDGLQARLLAEKLRPLAAGLKALSTRVDLPEGALRIAVELELGEPAPAPK